MSRCQQDGVFLCFPAWLGAFHWCHRLIPERVGSVWVCVIGQMGPPVIPPRWNTELYSSGFLWSSLPRITLYVLLIQASEVVGMVGAPDWSVFGSLLPKSWPNACWTESKAGGGCWLLPSPARRWPALKQHFTADVFCSGRQDVCLKRSKHDNTSKSSKSFQWEARIWHWQHQCEAPKATAAICLKIWAAAIHLSSWKELLSKPTLCSPCFPLSQLQTPKMTVTFPADLYLWLRSWSQIEKKEGKEKTKKNNKPCLTGLREKEKYKILRNIKCKYWLAPSSPTLVSTEKSRKFEMHFAHRLSINNATLHFISLIFPMGSLSSLI